METVIRALRGHTLPMERFLASYVDVPTFLSCCRQGICFIPLILLLPSAWGLFGIQVCQPIADVLTFFISVPFLVQYLGELNRMEPAAQ